MCAVSKLVENFMLAQTSLFGDDPLAVRQIVEIHEEADLDIDIALAINPSIIPTADNVELVNEAIEALTFARVARKSGAGLDETAEALARAGMDAEVVMGQLADVEEVVGTSEHEVFSEAALEDFKATFGEEDEEVAELGAEDADEVATDRAYSESATSALSALMRQLRGERYAAPTAEQERALGMRLKSEDPQVVHDARNELVERGIRFVIYVAKSMQYTRRPLDILVSFAMPGLIRAAELFDPNEGRFTTYAAGWIKQAIQRGVEADGVFKTPGYLKTKERKLRALAETHADPATADALRREAHKVGAEIVARRSGPVSLDTTPSNDDDDAVSMHNLFASEDIGLDERMERLQLINKLQETAKSLRDPRATDIFLMHIGLHEDHLGEPLSLPEIEDYVDLKRERIRQIYLQSAATVCDRMEAWAKGPENLPEGFRKALKG